MPAHLRIRPGINFLGPDEVIYSDSQLELTRFGGPLILWENGLRLRDLLRWIHEGFGHDGRMSLADIRHAERQLRT